MRRSDEISVRLLDLEKAQALNERLLRLAGSEDWMALVRLLDDRREHLRNAMDVAIPTDVPKLQGQLDEVKFMTRRPDGILKAIEKNRIDQERLRIELKRVTLHETAYPGDPDIDRQKELTHG